MLGTVAFIAALAALKLVTDAASRIEETGERDPLADELWHRYEEGDLTRGKFERAIRKRRKNAA